MKSILDIFNKIEVNVLLFINKTLSNQFFDFLMPLFDNVKYWIPVILILWILLIYIDKKNRYKILILIPLAIIVGDFIGSQIKDFVSRPRPWVESELDITNLGFGKGKFSSFPSNHSLNIMSLATIFSHLYSQYQLYFWLYAAIIIFSRVYIGVHYPSDVFIGAVLGLMIGRACLGYFNYFKNLLKKN